MNTKEFFDSQQKESQRLVDALAAHMATWPTIEVEYNHIDAGCIELAAKLSAERLAGSPRAISTEAELIQLRRKRDEFKYLFRLKQDDLQRQIEEFTRPVISETAENWLDLARRLPEKYQFEREYIENHNGVAVAARISTNADALQAAKNAILESRRRLMEMRHCTLAEIRGIHPEI